MKQYLIGLDIGTSGTKCILVDPETGRVAASSTKEYPLYTPRAGWAEQNPEDWYRASCEAAREVMAKCDGEVLGISFSGQMHGLVALDENLEVIRPSILWCDQRTQAQCDWLTEQAGGEEQLLAYTNNQMLTGYTGGKILWMRDEEPELYKKIRIFCCPKDYIRFRLTGEVMTDVSDASGTGFFDTKKKVWAEELIEKAGLDMAIFPPFVESTAPAGKVTAKAALETGLPVGLQTYAGGGDAVIQTTGAGLVKPGTAGVVIGTAGNVSMAFDRFEANPRGALQMFCSNEPGLWLAFGSTNSAGGAYRWYRDTLCVDLKMRAAAENRNVYDLMGEEAEASRPGANGVVFTPYLSGERCPYPDPNARGVFYGLSLSSTRGDMTRAVMEGVTYSLKQVCDILNGLVPVEKIYSSGGGSASKLWLQMQADIFDLPVYTMSAAKEGGAYGAVLVAGVGAGVWKDLGEAASVIKAESETLPVKENQAAYREAYALYGELYPTLAPLFKMGGKN